MITLYHYVIKDSRDRTKKFAVRVFALIDHIPQIPKGRVVQYQLAEAASSAAANYRAAQRSRSRAEFNSKLNIALEEIDESCFWIELLVEAGMIAQRRASDLQKEGSQLCAIMVSSRNTARRNGKTLKEPKKGLTLTNRSPSRNSLNGVPASRRPGVPAFPAFPAFPALIKLRIIRCDC
jgi:four helix bundle protein